MSKKGTSEEFPFDTSTLVFKVMGKIFTLTNVDNFDKVNLKCDPELAIQLREKYQGVSPGYHMNKKHWNTVCVNKDINDIQLKTWIDYSYTLVVKGLPSKLRLELDQ